MLEQYKRQAKEQGVNDVEIILYYGNPRVEIPQRSPFKMTPIC
ncbi:hypothetical protein [Salicibibacter cibarius]|nr:hypothetical protein [Salicibibacter cibarius]